MPMNILRRNPFSSKVEKWRDKATCDPAHVPFRTINRDNTSKYKDWGAVDSDTLTP